MSKLAQSLQSTFAIETFVETGTYQGDGAAFGSANFPKVVTIEIRDDFRQQAMTRLDPEIVVSLLGDSATLLPKVVADLNGPALFWLDGHAGAGFYGDQDNCPLLEELKAIAASPHEHFILVDDARAFLAPCPPPFDSDAWPTLREVIDAACSRFDYHCVVICDCIVFVPRKAKAVVTAFCNYARPSI